MKENYNTKNSYSHITNPEYSGMKKIQKVVMLPTEKESSIWLQKETNKLHTPLHCLPKCEVRHLYFLSNDEIKEGDWYININGLYDDPTPILRKCPDKQDSEFRNSLPDYFRVVSSTDKELTPSSWIRDNFVQNFIEAYNEGKPITEVSVEYDTRMNFCKSGCDYCNMSCAVHTIKTRLDGSVIIHQAKNYSFEEIKILCRKAYIDSNTIGLSIEGLNTEADEWIEQNL